MTGEKFTWVPFFKEVHSEIHSGEYNESKLAIIANAIFGGIKDENPKGVKIDIREMSPINFIGYFNRKIRIENKINACQQLKKMMNLKSDVPKDFDGIPEFNNQNCLCMSFEYNREKHIIKGQWEISSQILHNKIDSTLFNRILSNEYPHIGISYLSRFSFIVSPESYYPYDSQMAKNLNVVEPKTYDEYINYCSILKAFYPDKTPYELSHEAFLQENNKTSKEDINHYWLNLSAKDVNNNKINDLISIPRKNGTDSTNFNNVTLDDNILGYLCTPDKQVSYLLKFNELKNQTAEFKIIKKLDDPIGIDDILAKTGLNEYFYYGQTLVKLDERIFNLILKTSNGGDNMINKINQPLNQILYGPPGTGKTYNTALKAVEILEPQTNVKSISRQELMDKYEEYRKNNQIKFVTFHQSYAYEEFVEGIRPDLSNDDCGLRYILHKGIFKEIAELAKSEYAKANVKSDIDFSKTNFFKMSLGNTLDKDDSDVYDYCISNGVIALGYGADVDFSSANSLDEIKNIFNSTEKFKDETPFIATAVDRFKLKIKIGDVILISNGNRNVRAIGIIESDYFFDNDTEIRYSQFRKVKWVYEGADIPVDKVLNNKNLSQQTIYEFYNVDINKEFLGQFFSGTESPEKKNYVLIIDEINRGEISKVFGELITLIEKSKRTNDENVEVKLPYSGQLFSLPPNLFIVGTMNTADRSIALLDIALRRRFDFIPMYPDSSIIGTDGCEVEVDGINLAELLDQMNERIGALMDDDHKIGHSYLMGIKGYDDLNYAFKNRILPLLQEYFYNNYEKIAKVLNQDEDYEGEDNWNNTEDTIIHKKIVLDNIPKYSINEHFTKAALIKVYQ